MIVGRGGAPPGATALTRARAAANDRAQARPQLGDRERLGQIVVGARIEPGDPILDCIPCRQHQHGSPDVVRAQSCAQLESIEPRQHHIEHDRVIVARPCHPQSVLTRRREIGGVAALAQPAA
jgi:hypothetical protein